MLKKGCSLRLATEEDLPFILSLHEKEHVRQHLNPPREDVLREIIKSGEVSQYIAELDGTAAGLLVLGYPESWLMDLRRIIVEHPRKGLGREIMEWTVDHAFREKSVKRISLEVPADNTNARRLYERMGFTLEGAFRQGYFNKDTGAFSNLCIYGLLESDPRSIDLLETREPRVRVDARCR
ncbi:MAG TPA: GNAT family N-acetyltransferase [Candidatus Baltobacteraceae bacterium]|jgi:RimJ/RimL family protein N-acetyltransferase|nr:GNAT family N-acetyltransferase [Candidatus Baltobacteraceae bacterium]